jgi:hypothetical protein
MSLHEKVHVDPKAVRVGNVVDGGLALRNLFSENICFLRHRKKDKAIALQAWTGPEGSRRLRLQDFKTVVL